MQLPKRVQADQFQGNPAIDRRAHSMASSRLDNRERNKAFLYLIIRTSPNFLENKTHKNRSQGSVAFTTRSRSSLIDVFTGTGGWWRLSSHFFKTKNEGIFQN